MPVTLSTPDGLAPSPFYQHVAVGTGTRHVHIAGQVSTDAAGEVVAAGDLAGQTAQAFRNVHTALTSVGATFADVVRLTIYVVDWTPDKIEQFAGGVAQVAEEIGYQPAPASLIGVQILFDPSIMIEVEATAILE
ncbi:MAG TPA: RidA family protein [Thermomicrobiales bacterium]|jgi:enamine deaminase RidA (YjgF/YER057c/UK114 family)|nr:RidA family protein [Thermomicrobiales bacterium]